MVAYVSVSRINAPTGDPSPHRPKSASFMKRNAFRRLEERAFLVSERKVESETVSTNIW
jgi:hypothetical protein